MKFLILKNIIIKLIRQLYLNSIYNNYKIINLINNYNVQCDFLYFKNLLKN